LLPEKVIVPEVVFETATLAPARMPETVPALRA
jgi:hypothetical protein